MFRRRYNPYARRDDGAGVHAPHINLTHVNGDIRVELKKTIQSGEERTLLLTPEQFFEISHKSDEIRQAGHAMADYRGPKTGAQPSNTIGSFKFVLRSDLLSDNYEHMYEWEIPNSSLRVNIRNRRSDGKRPIDAKFVVEIRVFTANDRPTNEGIMMAWHNFNGTFVHHRKERRDRIQEMRRNGLSNYTPTPSVSNSAAATTTIFTPVASLTNERNLPNWTIDENHVNKEAYSCVICMDTYVKGERVHGLPRCSHYFHSKCIDAWLLGSTNCPICRSEV